MVARSKYWFSGMRRRSGQQRAASVRAAAREHQAPGIPLFSFQRDPELVKERNAIL